jgi:hypothetical protein
VGGAKMCAMRWRQQRLTWNTYKELHELAYSTRRVHLALGYLSPTQFEVATPGRYRPPGLTAFGYLLALRPKAGALA